MAAVKFSEKLRKLTEAEQGSRAEIARRAGLKPSLLNNYVNRGSAPMAGAALALARYFRVPLDWLIDDSQDPPAPVPQPVAPLQDFSDDELMHEVTSRHRRALLALLESLRAAKEMDWKRAADDVEHLKPGEPPSDLARQAFALLVTVESRFGRAMQDFDLYFYSVTHHSTLPGKEHSLSELNRLESGHAYGEFADNPAVPRFSELAKLVPEFQAFPQKSALERYKTTSREFHTLLSPPPQGRK